MAHTIGIIGGADGPTAIFITGNPYPAILAVAALVISSVLIIRFFRKKK